MPTELDAALYHSRERLRNARRIDKAQALIDSPHDLGTVAAGNPSSSPLTLPYDAEYGISFSAGITSGELTVATEPSRSLGTPDLAADQVRKLGFFHKDRTFTPASDVAGDVTLYIFDNWSRPKAIATGTFS